MLWEEGGGVTVGAHPEQNEVKPGILPESPLHLGFVGDGCVGWWTLSFDPMHVILWDRYGVEQRLSRGSVVAGRMVRRNAPLVRPEDVHRLPRDPVRRSESSVEVKRSLPARESDGESAPCSNGLDSQNLETFAGYIVECVRRRESNDRHASPDSAQDSSHRFPESRSSDASAGPQEPGG